MYFDGALNLEGAGTGVLLISPQGEKLKYVPQIHYKASNNGAEYEALIHGLRIAVSLGIKWLLAFGDSKVVIEQVNKEWDCVKDTMDAYCAEICKLEGHFEGIEFQHAPRNNNVTADVLSKLGSQRAIVQAGVFVQDLHKPSIKLLRYASLTWCAMTARAATMQCRGGRWKMAATEGHRIAAEGCRGAAEGHR
jgi:ribonuclease HI